MNKNIPYYLFAVLVFILMKLIYTGLDTSDLLFILKPTNTIIAILTNTGSELRTDSGYYNEQLNILIDRSCSGFNFWIICFSMLAFSIIPVMKTPGHKIAAIILLIPMCYLLTIFVNTSRILVSLQIGSTGSLNVINSKDYHQAQGVFVYFFFLVSIYLAFNFLLTKYTTRHAKPA